MKKYIAGVMLVSLFSLANSAFAATSTAVAACKATYMTSVRAYNDALHRALDDRQTALKTARENYATDLKKAHDDNSKDEAKTARMTYKDAREATRMKLKSDRMTAHDALNVARTARKTCLMQARPTPTPTPTPTP